MIRDRQVAVAILKEARNIGLVNHLLRAVHPAIWTQPNRNILDSFDEKAFILFAQHVLGDLHGDDTDFLERDILAIAAPIKSSGTAFRKASAIAACAWLSSIEQFFGSIMELATPFVGNERDVRELIERLAVPARAEFNTHIPGEPSARVPFPHFTAYVPPDPQRDEKEYNALKTLQSRRSHCVDEANVRGRYEGLPHQGMTRAMLERRVKSMRPASLFAIDGRHGGIEYTNEQTSAILQAHLGLEYRFAFHGKSALRQCPGETLLNHSLGSCPYIITKRHDELVEALAEALREAGIHGRIETSPKRYPIVALDRNNARNQSTIRYLYPGDFTIHNYRGTGQMRYGDLTVADTQALANRGEEIQKLLLRVHHEKRKKYDFSCHQQGAEFHPIVMTHLGVLLEASSVTISIMLGINKPVPGVFPSADQRRRMLIKRNLMNKFACINAKYFAQSIIMHAPEQVPSQNTL
jgi:hypothetical protein